MDTFFSSHSTSISDFRRRSYPRSMSSSSSISSATTLRLADIAKQHGLGVHVENWREDMIPVRQYLPMQHIIGSLKRDRDEQVQYISYDTASSLGLKQSKMQNELSTSQRSEDSFLETLRTPKRRRTSDCSRTDSQSTTDSDPDRRFSYQAAEHIAKDIPQSALPGLNHVLNLATITADERDIFSEYAPKHLDDSQLLMNEVLQLREQMMIDPIDEVGEDEYAVTAEGYGSPIIPREREDEVQRAFEDFLDLNDSNRFIAKI